MIKANINDILRGGFELESKIEAQDVSDEKNDYLKFTEAISLDLTFDLTFDQGEESTIVVKTKAHGRFTSYCSRCLKEISGVVDKEFFLDFQITQKQEELEIDDDIRQEFIASLPISVICNVEEQVGNQNNGITLDDSSLEEKEKCKQANFKASDAGLDETGDGTYQPFANL
jgi:uncharacterized metal-binding protein YceD (DUF177 family)